MIVATEFILSVAVAFILSLLFSWLLRRGGPRFGFPLFFLVIFLITLAGGLWLKPFGPLYWGVYWLPFIVVGIIGSVLLFLAAPKRPPFNRKETLEMLERIEKEKELERMAHLSFNMVIQVLVIILIVSVVLHYLLQSMK